MPPSVSTVNDDPSTLSDREYLQRLAGMVSKVISNTEILLDKDEVRRKQLDHLDGMLHEVWQFVEEHKPALAKALAFLEPGRSLRDYFGKGRRDAVPQNGQGQVQEPQRPDLHA